MTSLNERGVEALKPCPFCGATPHKGPTKAMIGQDGEAFQRYRVWCPHMHASFEEAGERQAIAAWNRRAQADAGTKRLAVDDLAQKIRLVDGENSLGAGELAEALMPFVQADAGTGVRVKLLEWEAYQSATGSKAYSTLGLYEVMHFDGWGWRASPEHFLWHETSSEDEAKAAAQADYEQRILSAIEPSPISEPTEEEIERAAVAMAKEIGQRLEGLPEDASQPRLARPGQFGMTKDVLRGFAKVALASRNGGKNGD